MSGAIALVCSSVRIPSTIGQVSNLRFSLSADCERASSNWSKISDVMPGNPVRISLGASLILIRPGITVAPTAVSLSMIVGKNTAIAMGDDVNGEV